MVRRPTATKGKWSGISSGYGYIEVCHSLLGHHAMRLVFSAKLGSSNYPSNILSVSVCVTFKIANGSRRTKFQMAMENLNFKCKTQFVSLWALIQKASMGCSPSLAQKHGRLFYDSDPHVEDSKDYFDQYAVCDTVILCKFRNSQAAGKGKEGRNGGSDPKLLSFPSLIHFAA